MEKNNIDVSIIIVNFNTYQLTCNCISSIIKNTNKVNYEIILIDNASKECSPQLFKNKYPQIILIKNQINQGFGIANNQGMEAAKGNYLLLLNSDTYLLNEAIDQAHSFAKNRTQYSIFGAKVLNPDMSEQQSYFTKSGKSIKSAFRAGFVNANPLLSKVFKPKSDNKSIGGLYGAYIFMKREVFESTKGFDPDFFMYCEDTEWFRNRIGSNYKIDICKEAEICHLSEGSNNQKKLVNKQNIGSYYLYWYKFGYSYFMIYFIGSYFNSLTNFLLLPFMSKIERSRNYSIIIARFSLIGCILSILKYSNQFGSRPKPFKI